MDICSVFYMHPTNPEMFMRRSCPAGISRSLFNLVRRMVIDRAGVALLLFTQTRGIL